MISEPIPHEVSNHIKVTSHIKKPHRLDHSSSNPESSWELLHLTTWLHIIILLVRIAWHFSSLNTILSYLHFNLQCLKWLLLSACT